MAAGCIHRALDATRLRAWAEAADARFLVGTHSGLPWIKNLGDGQAALNCGVAGRPDHDGDAAVHYLLMRPAPSGEVHFEFRRVAYDAEAWCKQLLAEGVDPIFVAPLRSGWWTVGKDSLPDWERNQRHTGAIVKNMTIAPLPPKENP